MVKLNILLENFSIDDCYKQKHGLSILINYDNINILSDVGPDKTFTQNAQKMNIDLSKVDYLFLSHNHIDHTGGLNDFLRINKTSNNFIMGNAKCKYYIKKHSFLYIPIGLKLKKANYKMISQIENEIIVDNKIYFIHNTISHYNKPTFNKVLYKRENKKIINDNFDHEGILVLDDNNELLIFNSCSHNGFLNIVETVKEKFPNKKIKGYVGGLHLYNPGTKDRESNEYLDYLIKKIKAMNINIYTGHCTGRYAVDYLRKNLGEIVKEINTGMELEI
jgi:7,8-dihydropterin-6-yl-methyl-4-(beta-D-ribofuranosyl)aminobenzene 5'-phosphate synthase